MKRLIPILLLLCTTAAFAQVPSLKSKVFEVRNHDPQDIVQTIKLLGSGDKGADMSINRELHTITIRDYPENLATMEEAIRRLDQPAAATPDIEFKISVLIGSKTPFASGSVPEELEPVVKQLQSTLRYAHYALMTANVQRAKPHVGAIEGSGVVDSTLLNMDARADRPIMYSYRLVRVSVVSGAERPGVEISSFQFSMRFPVNVGAGPIQYQNVGFDTPVTIHQNEKVVIGTTTMGTKALIVVVSATVK